MKLSRWMSVALFLLTGAAVAPAFAAEPAAPLPRLHVAGLRIVDADNRPVFLHGVNLGNWLLIEPGGLGGSMGKFLDQYTLFSVLRDRFGEVERRRLIDLYRDNYITARDFDNVQRFGFNFVRIGFDYELMEDDARPMQLRPDAFKYLDFAVREAKARGLYILFDLHGAQERQVSGKQGGRSGYTRFWVDPKAQERSLWLWSEIQKRYRNETTVMGYEPLNEPFSAKPAQLRDYCERWYTQLRTIDPAAIAVFPGMQSSIEFYGKPADHGWTNAMFDMHFYPGSFAKPTATQPITLTPNTRFVRQALPKWVDRMAKMGTPLLIGEMNVVYQAAGGGEMVRRYYDFAKAHDWGISFWTLKELTPGGGVQERRWMLTTNANPIPAVDVHTSSIQQIEAAFRSLGTMPLTIDQDLLHWLTTDQSPRPLSSPRRPADDQSPVPTGAQPQ